MVAWPASLPQSPLFEGNSVALGDNRVSFKPDVGRALVRRRYTTRDDTVSFTFRMSRAQLVDFLSFYNTDLGDGVLEFTYDDPTIDENRTFTFERPPSYAYVKPLYVDVTCVWMRHGVSS